MGMMLNRRRVMGNMKLPYDAKVEYLESTKDAQYIDTGIIIDKADYTYYIDFTPTRNETTECPFGSSKNAFWDGQFWGASVYIGSSTINKSLGRKANERIRVKLTVKNNHITIYKNENILLDTTFNGTPINGFNVLLFGYTYGTARVSHPAQQKVHSFYLEIGGQKVLDYIPVRVGTTGYMYDKVSGKLFGNAGTGAFILGPDK